MHVGASNTTGVGRQDDRPVHLRQLREPLRAERGVEKEAARADVEHVRPIAHYDEGAHFRLYDAIEPFAQRRSRCDLGERGLQRRTSSGDHAPSLGRPFLRRSGVRTETSGTEGVADVSHWHQLEPVDGLADGGRHERSTEAETSRFGQATRCLTDVTDLAAEPNFPAGDHRRRHRSTGSRRGEGETEGEVASRFDQPDTADG
jgi:hypothetical protein